MIGMLAARGPRQRTTSLAISESTNNKGDCRKSATRDKELVRLCKMSDYAEDVYSEEPMEEISMFDIEGSSGIDVKVPCTENPAMLVWENGCADEVQNCRQIAATDTVTRKENQNNETSESSGQPPTEGGALRAMGRLSARTSAISQKNLVCCSMLTRSSR